MKSKLIRACAIAAIAVTVSSSLMGCLVSDPRDDEFTISSSAAQFDLHVTANDFANGESVYTFISKGPTCGVAQAKYEDSQTPYFALRTPQVIYDRSSGVAAGLYFFSYELEVKIDDGPYAGRTTQEARVKLNLLQSYPSPDGSPPCNAVYQAFISSARNLGGSVSVSWIVPEGLEIADEYLIVVRDGDPLILTGNVLGSLHVAPPSTHQPQTSIIPLSGGKELLWISLSTIKDRSNVFIDILKGVEGDTPGFILVDDYAQLVQGSRERTTVDVLANDYIMHSGTARGGANRLDNANLTIIGANRLNATVTSGQQVEVDASRVEPGQYIVAIETTVAGADSQRQYLYVDFLKQQRVPPTLNDDSFTGFAGEAVPLPVLDNDSAHLGGPLTIASFTQPGGDATVTQVGQELQITGPVGEYNFSYTAEDEFGNTASARVYVRLIRRAPIPQ